MHSLSQLLDERIFEIATTLKLSKAQSLAHNKACALVMKLSPKRFRYPEEKKFYSLILALLFKQQPLPIQAVTWLEGAVNIYSMEAEERNGTIEY